MERAIKRSNPSKFYTIKCTRDSDDFKKIEMPNLDAKSLENQNSLMLIGNLSYFFSLKDYNQVSGYTIIGHKNSKLQVFNES
jgi:hypothetical protein